MKKITVWMLALMLVPGLLVLAGCKKAEEPPAEEPMAAEATPTPMEPMVEATPVPDVTPMAGDNVAPATATPAPAAQ